VGVLSIGVMIGTAVSRGDIGSWLTARGELVVGYELRSSDMDGT
jgi:hypothetical protein